jgi:hypothetical protein
VSEPKSSRKNELYQRTLRAYMAASLQLESAQLDEFEEAYVAVENARIEFERVSGVNPDPGV